MCTSDKFRKNLLYLKKYILLKNPDVHAGLNYEGETVNSCMLTKKQNVNNRRKLTKMLS